MKFHRLPGIRLGDAIRLYGLRSVSETVAYCSGIAGALRLSIAPNLQDLPAS